VARGHDLVDRNLSCLSLLYDRCDHLVL
jgi:hypothetical protein